MAEPPSDAEWSRLIADVRSVADDLDRGVEAAMAIGEQADQRRVPALYNLAADDDFFVREAAAVALGRLEGARALPALTAAHRRGRAEGHDNDSLTTVIISVIESDPEQAKPVLARMAQSQDGSEREIAEWGLRFIRAE